MSASSNNAAQTPGFDPVTVLQHQLQSFNFGAAPGGMDPTLSHGNGQAGQWPSAGAQRPQQPSIHTAIPGMLPNAGQNQGSLQPGQSNPGGPQHLQQSPGAMNPGLSRENHQAGQWPPGGPQQPQQPSLPTATPGLLPNGARHQSSAQPGLAAGSNEKST